MYVGKSGGKWRAGLLGAVTLGALVLWLPTGGAALAAAAGSMLGGPMQAFAAAASLAADMPAATDPAATAAPEELAVGSAAESGAQSHAVSQNETAASSLPEIGGLAGLLGDAGESDEPAASSPPAPAVSDTYPLTDEAAPAGAGTVTEKHFTQSPGGIFTACGAGTIRNNTPTAASEIEAAVAGGMPFAVETDTDAPQVLILHTHATETYRTHAGLWFAPEDTARSTDTAVNMCAVGAVMADTLNAAGICTLHDCTLNDYPSYTGSYANSRAVAQNYLAKYPSIKVVLDVHRDAMETGGARIAPVCTVNGRQAAQVMIICGCDNGDTVKIPNYRENLRFAAAWESRMEGDYSGLTRPVLFSYRFYNQDLSTGALLIEVGGHGSTLDEALYAGHLAAESLAALFRA